eukprot:6212617-Pleurochrysis_carterae.AAC.3
MELDVSLVHPELTWLLGMTKTGQILDPAHLAIIRIYWRHVYAAMVRLKYEGEPFSSARVKSDVARTLLARILAYQYERRLWFSRRRHSHSGGYKLPKSAAKQVQHIGNLRLTDGTLTVKAFIISAIEQQGVSCIQFAADLPLSSPSATLCRPSTSSPDGKNDDLDNHTVQKTPSESIIKIDQSFRLSIVAALELQEFGVRILDSAERQRFLHCGGPYSARGSARGGTHCAPVLASYDALGIKCYNGMVMHHRRGARSALSSRLAAGCRP